jgi:hypothetical protein
MPLKWQHPFNALLAGVSGAGKTVFTLKFITNIHELIDVNIERVIWCYSVVKPNVNIERDIAIEFVSSVDAIYQKLIPVGGRYPTTFLVIDDQMENAKQIQPIFTKFTHHRNCSCFYLTQNLFMKDQRTISLNTHVFVLFKCPRDRMQIMTLAKQISPDNPKFILQSFNDATSSSPFSYLIIDLKPATPEDFRVRTNIFPGEQEMVYLKV